MFATIFFEFHLPNSTSWFYFSLALTIALFFHFQRPLALRNLDLIALFLFVPGFLLLQEANQHASAEPAIAAEERIVGYVWLLSSSAYWFVRCFLDLGTVRRPAFRSNLTLPGLIFLGLSLFICLTAVATRRPADAWEPIGKQSVAIESVADGATAVVSQGQPVDPASYATLRNWTVRGLAMLAHTAVVIGLFLVGWKHFRDAETGAAMGALYLLLPYTAFHISQLHHVLPAALVLWAIFAYRHPRVSGWLLGIAAGTTFFPALLLPLWLHFYWRRGTGRFLSGFLSALAVALALTFSLVWLAGYYPNGLSQQLHLSDWQPWKRPLAESFWQGVHWAYRLPVFIVFVAFTLASFFWPSIQNVTHVAAMSAAILIGIQFWYADRGGLYVLWYTPLLLLVVFRPTTTDLEPPILRSDRGWGTRMAVGVWNRVWRRSPQAQASPLAA